MTKENKMYTPEFRNDPQPPLSVIMTEGTKLLNSHSGGIKISIIGSVTTDFIARAIGLSVAQEGEKAHICQSPFGVWRQEILNPASSFYKFNPDIIVIAIGWRDILSDIAFGLEEKQIENIIYEKVRFIENLWKAILKNLPKSIVVQHLPDFQDPYENICDLNTPSSFYSQCAQIRSHILKIGKNIIFLDMKGLPRDDNAWFAAKLPFAQSGLSDYVSRFRSCFRQARSKVKKVLALDLDNTLWGGVIGDDGVNQLLLGPDTAIGEAFSSFQKYIKSLGDHGVILAVCSKNDPSIAETGFSHPHSILRKDDFQAFECNWTDKASALRRIAKKLNVSTESIVFVDDNPVECDLVCKVCPEITVINLGKNPSNFIIEVARGRWFETQRLSDEDLLRKSAYRARAAAAAELEESPSLEKFLQDLNMRSSIMEAKPSSLERVAQLESKTNQFNLTTRRYSLSSIENFLKDGKHLILVATLSDKFGDHGLVSSVIASIKDDTIFIDSWLMSCRVFSRTLEEFIMKNMIDLAREKKIRTISGIFLPTNKNDVVKDVYSKLGFTKDNEGIWSRAVNKSTDDLITYIHQF